MAKFWQTIFLTVGILIAVFGMRLVFPLLIVGITAHLWPIEAVDAGPGEGHRGRAGHLRLPAERGAPAIAAFGGMFLLMIFLDFIFEERDITWLSWLERPLAGSASSTSSSVVVAPACCCVIAATQFLAEDRQPPC